MSKWSSAYRDSRWQQKRLEIMQRDGFRCQSCFKTGPESNLCVHHIYYEQGKAPWEYPDDSLVTWCEKCHSDRHEAMRKIGVRLAKLPLYSFDGAVNLLCTLGCGELNAVAGCPEVIRMIGTLASDVFTLYAKGLKDGFELTDLAPNGGPS